MTKIVFFDIDGTLIELGKKEMRPKVVEAINKLQENGIMVFAATGRPPYIVPKFDGVEFDGMLTFNGQLCIYQDKIIHQNPLDKEEALKIIENAKSINKACMAANATRMGANFYDKALDEYMLIADPNGAKVVDDFNELVSEEPYQMMISVDKEQEKIVMKDLNHISATRWHPGSIDVIPSHGGKGIGIKKILEHFGFDVSESMAFGDGGNDIDMLETVGVGIAMGNAFDEVKKIADYITKDVSEDGVYWALKEFNLI